MAEAQGFLSTNGEGTGFSSIDGGSPGFLAIYVRAQGFLLFKVEPQVVISIISGWMDRVSFFMMEAQGFLPIDGGGPGSSIF